MKNRNNTSKHIGILRNQDVRTTNELSGMAEKFMRNRTAYLSVLAGVSIVTFGQAQNVLANGNDKEIKVPAAPVAQGTAAIVADLNQRCTTPDLLKRQTNFRLPHQEWKYDLVSAFVGGDNCPGATVPPGTYTTGTPYTDSGSTVGANNTVTSIQTGCSNYTTVAGPDHIYAFKISALGAAPTISMTTSTGTYDPAIYILNGATGAMCPAGTANAVTNCLKGADVGLAGAGETITTARINTLPLNTQLYLFVDSFYSTAAGSGNYIVNFSDMTVVGNAPVQHIDDFNGDGRSDYAVTRTAGSQITWYIYNATVPEPDGPVRRRRTPRGTGR